MPQTVILGTTKTNPDKPLERVYQLFESVVSNLQTQMHIKGDEKMEETSMLLRQQYRFFFEAHKVLQDHLEEYVTTEEVLRSWYTYCQQLFQ